MQQSRARGIAFDYVVHCTGSSSTQAGLLAGFAALEATTRVIGVSDDDEIEIKKARVLQLANDTLDMLGLSAQVSAKQVDVVSATLDPYGVAGDDIVDGIQLLARTEGVMADPVYEGRAVRGLLDQADQGRFAPDSRILLMHLGGTPAIHAYAHHFAPVELTRFEP